MANPFTPEQISQILEEFFKVVGTRQYIGARYVPIFGRKGEESIEWDNSAPYEPLTIVLYQGNSYTSRQYVPVGVEITNQEFWAITGNYNAQVEQYRRDVQALDGRVSANATAIDAEKTRAENAEQTLQDGINTEKTRAENAEQTLQTKIDVEKTRAEDAETNLNNKLYYVTPEEYGAVGDGITDDSAAIQQAINSGKLVKFGSKYACKNIKLINKVHLIGNYDNKVYSENDMSPRGLLINLGNTNTPIFDGDGTRGGSIIGLEFIGGKSLANITNITVRGCYFKVTNAEENIPLIDTVKMCKFTNCTFAGVRIPSNDDNNPSNDAMYGYGITNATDSYITNSEFRTLNCAIYGVNHTCSFVNNRIEWCYYGVRGFFNNTVFLANTFDRNTIAWYGESMMNTNIISNNIFNRSIMCHISNFVGNFNNNNFSSGYSGDNNTGIICPDYICKSGKIYGTFNGNTLSLKANNAAFDSTTVLFGSFNGNSAMVTDYVTIEPCRPQFRFTVNSSSKSYTYNASSFKYYTTCKHIVIDKLISIDTNNIYYPVALSYNADNDTLTCEYDKIVPSGDYLMLLNETTNGSLLLDLKFTRPTP